MRRSAQAAAGSVGVAAAHGDRHEGDGEGDEHDADDAGGHEIEREQGLRLRVEEHDVLGGDHRRGTFRVELDGAAGDRAATRVGNRASDQARERLDAPRVPSSRALGRAGAGFSTLGV